MKALSLKQPWANLIALGWKTIETRTWRTNYRGPLLICASKTIDSHAAMEFKPVPPAPRGCAITLVDLVTCRRMTKADEAVACCDVYPGAWAWILENVRPIEQFPVRGQLGIFEVELPDGWNVNS